MAVPLLDVVLGYDCNLACTYCTIGEAMRPKLTPPERVALEIDRAAAEGFTEVAFTGGEPTIYPSLLPLVRRAKQAGFAHVKVASNGLRYADPAYLDRVIAAGVDRFHVSMHAFDDDAYERTVRAPGAAKLRRAAIAALVSRRLDPVADLILKEDTYRDVAAWIAELANEGVAPVRALAGLAHRRQRAERRAAPEARGRRALREPRLRGSRSGRPRGLRPPRAPLLLARSRAPRPPPGSGRRARRHAGVGLRSP